MTRLGIAGAGLPGLDHEKATDGVLVKIPSGYLKGVELKVRSAGKHNARHQQFMDEWAKGKFKDASTNGSDPDAVMKEGLRATQTPEYVAHVLIADIPSGIAIPDAVESLEALPESTRDAYTKNGDGYRRKKNQEDWVPYSPDVGVWLLGQERYADLTDWAWRLAAREEHFLEEQVAAEGNT